MATTVEGGVGPNVYTTMAAPAVHHREQPQREQHSRHGTGMTGGDVVKCGLLKKLKTSRKKWFVLRSETSDASARLEYYDSEKKWTAGLPAKRSIPLKTCFNINRRQDTKHKHVIALYTKDDCFCVVLESEEELDSWLRALLALQQGDEVTDGETPRPTFEHVWQVSVLSRGLGNGRTGNYRLCLTDKTLTLIKKDSGGGTSDGASPAAAGSVIDLNLSNIRSCGSLKNYFYLEIGRSSLLGAGELWMDSEDVNIAQNIHTTIYHAMTTNGSRSGGSGKGMAAISALEGATNEDLAPKTRTRSSSATESRPNNIPRKQVHSGVPKTLAHGLSQAGSSFHFTAANLSAAGGAHTGATIGLRERCDSMPSSGGGRAIRSAYVHHSPPGHGGGSPVSPPSAACSTTDSAGSSYSLADEADVCMGLSQHPHPPLTPDEAIEEEDCCCGVGADHIYGYEESTSHTAGGSSYVPMAVPSSDDGYVDMSPRGRAASPAASLASVTSGTPSTDYRFADYPLDKVRSYLATQEEDASRPARAYSLGSRPDGVTVRTRAHNALSALLNAAIPGGGDSYRDRAASVGSKSKRWAGGRVLVHHGSGHPPSAAHAGGGKSSSAPLLPIAGAAPHGSHGSIGPMEDLMEMDFSRGGRHSSSSDTTPSGYVEMKPGVDPLHKKTPSTLDVSPYVDMKPAGQTSSDYVDMSGTSPSKSQTSTTNSNASTSGRDYSSFVDINRQYGLTSNGHDSDHYTGRQRTFSRPSSSPADDYLDMGGNSRLLSTSPRTGTSVASASSVLSDYMPLGFDAASSNTSSSSSKTATEGYVEMSGTSGAAKGHHRQLSLDSHMGSVAESYANMSLGQGSKKKPTPTMASSTSSSGSSARKDKQQSQPISIYPTATATCMSHFHCKTTSSPITSLWGGMGGARKTSAGGAPGTGGGTPPKLHLSITSPYSSLPRQRHRRDSSNAVSCSAETDSVSSGSSITTPSSSSTIFPLSLNSPSSPMKPSTSASGKTETPTALKIPAAILNAFYKSGSSTSKSTSNVPVRQAPIAAPEDDYTLMDFQTSNNAVKPPSQQTEVSSRVNADGDYMMCSPATVEAVVSSANERIQPGSAQAQSQREDREEKDKDIEPPYEVLRSSAEAPSSSASIAEASTGGTPNSTEAPPKLHYASLDLAQQDVDASATSNMAQQPPNKPTYAQIDFIRTSGEDPGSKQSGVGSGNSQTRTAS